LIEQTEQRKCPYFASIPWPVARAAWFAHTRLPWAKHPIFTALILSFGIRSVAPDGEQCMTRLRRATPTVSLADLSPNDFRRGASVATSAASDPRRGKRGSSADKAR
jgi:hypothetical protein